MEHFGKDMRGLIDEIWQHLETREDSLTQLLEQKQGENATLRSVLEKGEQERQELQQQVGEMNKLHKSYEGQLQDLLHKVGKFETQQRVDSEAKACSEALAKENEDLKAQLETKCSTIAALDSQLTSESKSYRAQMESLSKEVAKLTHLMNESDHNARLMTEKAVAKTREECLADHQRTLEKVQERLQEAREARHLAVTELEEAKTQLKAMTITQGENGEQADKTAALRTALGDADLRNTKLADDLHGMAGKLSTQTRVFESIGKWASAKADALGLTFSLDKMWTDARTDGDEGKQWTSFLEAVLAEFSMGREAPRASSSARVAALQPSLNAQTHPRALHGTVQPLPPQSVQQSQEAGKRAGNAGDQSYQSLETGYDLPSREESSGLAAGSKRATVLSPDSGVLSPAPPSVEQERSRRRSNVQQPKPIIKRVTRSTLQGEEVRVGQSGDPAKIPPSTGSRNNPKRPRQTGQLQADNPFSPALVLEQDDDPIEDNEDAPQPKRAKAQKPKAVSVPRRGRDPASQPKQQTRRSGLAAPGVAHGRLPPRVPGIVANRHGLSSEPQNAS
jgi:phage shock protein A